MTKFMGLPFLASEHGAEVDKLILYVHYLMGALFIGWMAYFIYVLFRFRQSRNPRADYTGVKSHAASWIEGAVILVEAVLLIGFAIPLWARVADKFPSEKDAVVVRVIAEQFLWNFRYTGPDGVFGKQDPRFIDAKNPLGVDPNDPNGKDDVAPPINEMVVPVNKPVLTYISSKDVIHSFKVNPLRVTQDAMPGLSIPLTFTATHEGTYLINCAQLCGNSHFFMKGYVKVVSQTNYNEWLSAQTKKAPTATTFE